MHLALLCPDLTGHLNPMTTLGRELARRGHRVSVASTPVAKRWADRAELGFIPIGVPEDTSGELAADRQKLGEMTGFAALRFTGQLLAKAAAIELRDLPDALAGVDGVIVDQVSPSGGSVADALGKPFVVVCNALLLHREPGVPPWSVGWEYSTDRRARLWNRLGNAALSVAGRPIMSAVQRFRRSRGLEPLRSGLSGDYGLAQVAQQPAFFDYPRSELPAHFHYTGPWHESGRDVEVEFPWDRLDDRPLVYASLGTLQNRLQHVFQSIVAACEPLDVQLVLSLGRRDAKWDGPTPANAVIVPFAPQLALLERATVVVTHAGLNTALEALTCGKPMLCVPITNDQPGVASRVKWLGVGQVVPPVQAATTRIREAIIELIMMEGYQKSAMRCRKALLEGPGVRDAADIVEKALTTGQRVLRIDAIM